MIMHLDAFQGTVAGVLPDQTLSTFDNVTSAFPSACTSSKASLDMMAGWLPMAWYIVRVESLLFLLVSGKPMLYRLKIVASPEYLSLLSIVSALLLRDTRRAARWVFHLANIQIGHDDIIFT